MQWAAEQGAAARCPPPAPHTLGWMGVDGERGGAPARRGAGHVGAAPNPGWPRPRAPLFKGHVPCALHPGLAIACACPPGPAPTASLPASSPPLPSPHACSQQQLQRPDPGICPVCPVAGHLEPEVQQDHRAAAPGGPAAGAIGWTCEVDPRGRGLPLHTLTLLLALAPRMAGWLAPNPHPSSPHAQPASGMPTRLTRPPRLSRCPPPLPAHTRARLRRNGTRPPWWCWTCGATA